MSDHALTDRMDSTQLKNLSDGRALHLSHYAGARLPFACLEASGVTQTFVELDGPAAGRVFPVLDASGGYGSACLGAAHPVAAAALARAARLSSTTDEIASPERSRLLLELFGDKGMWTEAFPGDEYHVSGRNSGSEGMELALRLVLEARFDRRRLRHAPGRERRDTIVAFEGAWHGWTGGLLPLLNRRHYRMGLPAPASAAEYGLAVEHLPFGDAEAARQYFAEHGHRALGLFVEPVQGDAGILEPPRGYLRELTALARDSGALVVADEVLTFAKTGRYFAMADEAGPVSTDITVIGKSLGMGVVSTSMVIARRALTARATGAVSTSDLRPLTCAVIRDGLQYVAAEGLLERSAALGAELHRLLDRDLVGRFPELYREVRGSGFLQGVELTEGAAARLPELRRHLIRNGVYTEFMSGAGRRSGGLRYVHPAMRVAPPLVAGPGDVTRIVGRLAKGTESFLEGRP
ncbi:aminotransferase class III-fold pyridoxal phosphate-dependent enzyme [Streptomyces sp. GMR22]|uniref:aminotransferase class III-fold pyridoxal phosphate-dependent enzyme n=1 Tax=Streptomyces sp. GMR22 TaxID=2759524 RepID=UPI0015FA0549|nr:aminotransferase class III-fold pyridoxal phosphate-dependent enzyme [Streptomyces sp. GMR22]MBA6439085.1 aminotransferase class III-fold pyridoxal phosphate-dependent enzyme [Streptomyces sp. GMR22]